MLIAQDASLDIIGSANWTGPVPRHLNEVLTDAHVLALREMADVPAVLGQVTLDGTHWDIHAFRTGERVIAEFTPADDTAAPVDAAFLARLETQGVALERSSSFADLYQRAAYVFRDLIAFDRVMIYRFADDGAGVVVGESRTANAPSFMNHHFPATDIPRQARQLYVRNRVRVIADAGSTPVPLSGNDIAGTDLTDSILRAVSPVHIRYLRNMGVGASASVSIVRDGQLWGLIACHNDQPKTLSLPVRLAAQALAKTLSQQIAGREEADLYRERIRLRGQEDEILSNLGADTTLEDFFSASGKKLAELLNADGFAAVQGADLFTTGHCPDAIDLRALADHLRLPAAVRTFATHALPSQVEDAQRFAAVASGLIAVTMSTEVPTILMWFRAEHPQTVIWAGNPHKDVPHDPQAVLNPRTSFEAWTESVRGTARKWSHAEEEAAGRIVRLMLDARNNRRMRELNHEIATTLRENESLLRQKDFLMREMNHRVQNSLSLVSAFLRMQAREAGGEVRAQLAEAENRLKAVSLVHRRLYQNDGGEILDLARYLEDLMQEIRDTLDGGWGDHLALNLAPVLIGTDRAISIGLVLNELITNASKYAYGGRPGPVSVVLEEYRGNLRLIVADSGVGHDGTTKGSGFGSRMLASLVDRLGGHIDRENNHPGTRVIVTAPIR